MGYIGKFVKLFSFGFACMLAGSLVVHSYYKPNLTVRLKDHTLEAIVDKMERENDNTTVHTSNSLETTKSSKSD